MQKGYYKTKESVEEYIRLAKDVDGRQLIEKLREELPAHSKILEIGSGPGSDWKILSQFYNVTGSDNSNEFLQHLEANNPGGKFQFLDAISLKTEERFDGIYSNKVLHHLKDEELQASVKRQHQILDTGGIICHSFWKGKGEEVFKGLYVNYQDESNLKNIFARYFQIISMDEYPEFEEADSLLLIARKKE